MIVVNVQRRSGTSKKTGRDYDAFVVHGIASGYNGPECVEVWIEPSCPGVDKLKRGDQVRIGQEARGHFIQDLNMPATEELNSLLSVLM